LPDGRQLLSVHTDHTLRWWEPQFNREVKRVTAHPRAVPVWATLSPQLSAVATFIHGNGTFLWHAATGKPIAALMLLPYGEHLILSPEGHYQATEEIRKDLVYVLQTDHGQETLTPEEFSKRFGWQNDPAKVRVTSL
jgi:hypothetical protein